MICGNFLYSSIVLNIFFCYFVVGTNYSFRLQRLNKIEPVVSSQYSKGEYGSSSFTYSYNTAFAPLFDQNYTGGLFVRCQQNTDSSNPYNVGPSVISFVKRISSDTEFNKILIEPIDSSKVVIQPSGPSSSYGCEDPRVVYREKDRTYYILYSSVSNNSGIPISVLSLATTTDPTKKSSYILHGPIFPDIKWSKSGAMLIRDGYPGPHYLFWGDSSLVPGLQLATSNNLKNWTNQNEIFLPIRPSKFDSALVEAGPMPLILSDGNYLFLYNSARAGYPSPKPSWNLQYNVGYLILDGNNPAKILERSDEPIFSPETAWEIGSYPQLALTPNVVFVEGWYPVPNKNNTFVIFYGAADSVIGAAELIVDITN